MTRERIGERTRERTRERARERTRERTNRLPDYFRSEWRPLLLVALSGIVYNVGMVAGPWFEGRLAQCLADVIGGTATPRDMHLLAAAYVATILVVQGMRFLKRLYVRVFANNVNRRMKRELFARMLRTGAARLGREGEGALMTKAVSDVDDCVEGMRKFTTEVFDTGVVMVSYLAMLLAYDWRLTLVAMVFPPVAYVLAELLKRRVTRASARAKASMGELSAATMDRVSGAVSYRVFGLESTRDEDYAERLADYERAATVAGLWTGALQPIYQAISMLGMGVVIFGGARDVLGVGWASWDIAAFATYVSCFGCLAVKSSHAAKLFNAVQRARVSWERIRPYLGPVEKSLPQKPLSPAPLAVDALGVAFAAATDVAPANPAAGPAPAPASTWQPVLSGVTLHAAPGEVVGITGEVACGKSTLGRALAGEWADDPTVRVPGTACLGNRDLLAPGGASGAVGRLGHDPELLAASVADNVLLGDDGDPWPALEAARLADEVRALPDGLATMVGAGGVRLSGGQQARLALARTLHHWRPVMVLDDPFASVDKNTEAAMLSALCAMARETGCVVLLVSHRIAHFDELDQVVFLEGGRSVVGTHAELSRDCEGYRALLRLQRGGGDAHVRP